MLTWTNPLGTVWQLVNDKNLVIFTCTEKFFEVIKEHPEILDAIKEKTQGKKSFWK